MAALEETRHQTPRDKTRHVRAHVLWSCRGRSSLQLKRKVKWSEVNRNMKKNREGREMRKCLSRSLALPFSVLRGTSKWESRWKWISHRIIMSGSVSKRAVYQEGRRPRRTSGLRWRRWHLVWWTLQRPTSAMVWETGPDGELALGVYFPPYNQWRSK